MSKKIRCLDISAVSLLFISGVTHASVSPEKLSLDELYQRALKEGNEVTVYAGGDTPGQQDGIKKAFEQRFPGIKLNVIVDYSKFHDARVDNQLAAGTLVPDVVQLNYKPQGW